MAKKIEIKSIASGVEQNNRQKLDKYYQTNPLPMNEQVSNSSLFLKRQELSKILFLNHLYSLILTSQGIVIEFGVRWGQNLVTLTNLRGILEPYNYGRKIVGFDTFEGFKNVDKKDGSHSIIKEGAFSVTKNYDEYLSGLLSLHANESPLSHINKNEIFKGDAVVELKKYLKRHPETLISLAYFDFDIYKPTLECLKLIMPLMPKGSIIAFDELLDPHFPGETMALKEILGINYRLFKNPFGGLQSYIIIE
jgi:hypothetical protein